jgi:hypothetical protein
MRCLGPEVVQQESRLGLLYHLERGRNLLRHAGNYLPILIINHRDALNSQIYFWNRTLQVSDSSSVHHQESSTVHTAKGICSIGYADCLLASSQHNLMLFNNKGSNISPGCKLMVSVPFLRKKLRLYQE